MEYISLSVADTLVESKFSGAKEAMQREGTWSDFSYAMKAGYRKQIEGINSKLEDTTTKVAAMLAGITSATTAVSTPVTVAPGVSSAYSVKTLLLDTKRDIDEVCGKLDVLAIERPSIVQTLQDGVANIQHLIDTFPFP